MKQLLEEYIIEAVQMREQIGLLSAIIAWDFEDAYEVDLVSLQSTTPVDIKVTDGIVSIG